MGGAGGDLGGRNRLLAGGRKNGNGKGFDAKGAKVAKFCNVRPETMEQGEEDCGG